MKRNQESISCAISGRYHLGDVDLEEFVEAHPRKHLAFERAQEIAQRRGRQISIYDVMTKKSWTVTPYVFSPIEIKLLRRKE